MIALPSGFARNPPVPISELETCLRQFSPPLPGDYVEFLLLSNGGSGFLNRDLYVVLWPLRELRELNLAYEAASLLPGFLLIGSDGGGEALVLDRRSSGPGVAMVPFVGMDANDLKPVARSFAELFSPIDRPGSEIGG